MPLVAFIMTHIEVVIPLDAALVYKTSSCRSAVPDVQAVVCTVTLTKSHMVAASASAIALEIIMPIAPSISASQPAMTPLLLRRLMAEQGAFP